MRSLLFLSHRLPYPPNKGEKIRGWHVLQHLAQSWRVHLGCLVDDPVDWEHLPRLRDVCADVGAFAIDKRRQKLKALARMRPGRPLMLDYYAHPGLRAWTDAALARERFDVAYIFSAAMAPYVLPDGKGGARPRLVLDMMDIDSEKWATYAGQARWPMSLVWAREGRTLLGFERRAALACERTFLVSQQECDRFAQLAPETAGRVVPVENGVDLEAFSPAHRFDSPFEGDAPQLVFAGHMDYWPNADAAMWFAREVMPLLRARVPTACFNVVGANPGPEVLALAALPGVRVTGRVADVRPFLAHAAASVAPLRIARGIQNKVLEAMAAGVPVIASPQAYEGVRAEPGRDLLVGDGAADTARLVAEVVEEGHPGLGARGRQAVEAGYAWSRTFARLDGLLAEGAPGAGMAGAVDGGARPAVPARADR